MVSFDRKFFDGFPNLLDFADAQFGLIEKNEVLVQIAIIVKHEAFGLHFGVAPGTTRLLHIVLQRVTDVIVNDQSNIFLVNTHAKSRSGHNHLCVTTHKSILVLYLLVGFHLTIEWQC